MVTGRDQGDLPVVRWHSEGRPRHQVVLHRAEVRQGEEGALRRDGLGACLRLGYLHHPVGQDHMRFASIAAAAAALAAAAVAAQAPAALALPGFHLPYADPNQAGWLTLCGANLKPVTSGSIDAKPFVWRVVSDVPAP